jgi:pyruvate formate lyase activating enzyme
MAGSDFSSAIFMSPDQLADQAENLVKRGNIGLAFTYNEPLIGYEFIVDTATAIREKGLKNILVTNGVICEKPLANLLPLVDAMNIDLKGYSSDFYDWIQGGETAFEAVKKTVELASHSCHVEVAALIIPGRNDSVHEMRRMAEWLAAIDRSIPLHVSRFHPDWKCLDIPSTQVKTVYELAEAARDYLEYVYTGNC